MFGFVSNWFTPPANPIGVDFGTESLKMAQVDVENGEPRLIAAARADVPANVRHDPQARLGFFVQTVRDLFGAGEFSGEAGGIGAAGGIDVYSAFEAAADGRRGDAQGASVGGAGEAAD